MTAFDLDEGMALLERTPGVLRTWLDQLPDPWLRAREGEETWDPVQVVAHLIHGERVDWIARTNQILEEGDTRPFEPFDRFAHLSESRPLPALLEEFAQLRRENLATLRELGLREADLDRVGVHPEFGAVTLRQLLATWVVHDLTHVTQIARVMAKRYTEEVGPWIAYLSVLRR